MVEDSLDKALGRDVEVELGGKMYTMAQLTLGDWRAFRGWIRSRRIRDFALYAKDLAADEKQKVLVELSSQTISEQDQVSEFITPEGMIYMLWRSFKHGSPDLTLEKLESMLEDEDISVLNAMFEGLNTEGEESPPPKAVEETA